MADDADLAGLAKETRGLVGADLAALVNEAAIRAVREDRDVVTNRHLKAALADFLVSRAAFTGGAGPFGFGGDREKPAT